MIDQSFYLSDDSNIDLFCELTGMLPQEIESYVKRFRKDHWRYPGKLKGEVIIHDDGRFIVRHHFTKKKIIEGEILCDI